MLPMSRECFNCNIPENKCLDYGECATETGLCSCPTGFGSPNCALPLCGKLPARRRKPAEECTCAGGWTGMNCNVCSDNEACSEMTRPVEGICYNEHIVVENAFKSCKFSKPSLIKRIAGL